MLKNHLWGLVRTRVVGIDSLPMSTFSDVGRGTRCAHFPCGEMPGDRGTRSRHGHMVHQGVVGGAPDGGHRLGRPRGPS